jgi:hypothetical protein
VVTNNNFVSVAGITKYHHFDFEDNDRIVCREYIDSEERIMYQLRTAEEPSNPPEIIVPPGMSLERAWYLYKEVRTLCTDPALQDLGCTHVISAFAHAYRAIVKTRVLNVTEPTPERYAYRTISYTLSSAANPRDVTKFCRFE